MPISKAEKWIVVRYLSQAIGYKSSRPMKPKLHATGLMNLGCYDYHLATTKIGLLEDPFRWADPSGLEVLADDDR